jgi:hypothetical protein
MKTITKNVAGAYKSNATIDTSAKVAVFFDLEYFDECVITTCSVETFCRDPRRFHIFTHWSNEQKKCKVLEKVAQLLDRDVHELAIFDAQRYQEFDVHVHYIAHIFVLGNSKYTLKTFDYAIQLRNNYKRNYLYFHDEFYAVLLMNWVNEHHHSWLEFVHYYYPELAEDGALTQEVLFKNHIHMLRPIIDLTRCTNILVNAASFIPIIKKEVVSDSFNIQPVFLPIPDYRKVESASFSAAANLMFNRVVPKNLDTSQIRIKETIDTPNLTTPLGRKKLRILYGGVHRVLRYEEVPLFIATGFEVIPMQMHWDHLKTYEPGINDETDCLYPRWRAHCTIPDAILEKIQAIDLFNYHALNDQAGKISHEQKKLINEWIDIIYIPNLLPAVPRVLEWFEGLTLFRVFGEGKIMTYDEWAMKSRVDLSLLKTYDARYATMLMLQALNGIEHKSILGSNVFHVGPCISKNRIVGRWREEQSAVVCNITLSYITENPHWKAMYDQIDELLDELPLRILGKNNKQVEPLKHDPRVVGLIDDDKKYMDLLTDCRCLLDVGTSPFHTHYTPMEAMVMGIPVIFLESSGMAQEILRVIPKEELIDCGLCDTFTEAKNTILRCLEDICYAKSLSKNQQIIADRVFLPEITLKKIQKFAEIAPALVTRARNFSANYSREVSTLVEPIILSQSRIKLFIKKIVAKVLGMPLRVFAR